MKQQHFTKLKARFAAVTLICVLILNAIACSKTDSTADTSTKKEVPNETVSDSASDLLPYLDVNLPTQERVADLLSRMSLEDKAGQMVQGAPYAVTPADMKKYGLGSLLSGGGYVPGKKNTIENWCEVIDDYQSKALDREIPIPFLYGIDAVHGHNTLYGAVVFPQNIGLGAANDPDLVYQMGAAVAEEMKLTKTLFNFAPCVALAQDPRWGRTYESFSTDPEITSTLAEAYIKGQIEHGIIPTAKHYLADGGTTYGTGEGDNLIDRGDAQMSEDVLRTTHLLPYKRAIAAGVDVVMPSFSSFQGTKMHENKYLLTDVLKEELGFEGFVISDWEAIYGLSGGDNTKQNVANAINAGVDMLMQPQDYYYCTQCIVENVEDNVIPQERVDDAVTRILTVKMNAGLFEDPYLEKLPHEVSELGSEKYRELAKRLVEKSLVLVKNDQTLLPLKKGQKIFVTGPALDNIGVQCGGWTKTWQGVMDEDGEEITPGNTILEGLEQYAKEYDLEIITDPKKASTADLVLLAVGEIPYAEFEGDTSDLSLVGELGLKGNQDSIALAKKLNKPTITLIVAGRNVVIDEFVDDWDSIVMCYLPGTQGDGIASVLVNEAPFTGKLPMPWYKDVESIAKQDADLLYEVGYGLEY